MCTRNFDRTLSEYVNLLGASTHWNNQIIGPIRQIEKVPRQINCPQFSIRHCMCDFSSLDNLKHTTSV